MTPEAWLLVHRSFVRRAKKNVMPVEYNGVYMTPERAMDAGDELNGAPLNWKPHNKPIDPEREQWEGFTAMSVDETYGTARWFWVIKVAVVVDA